MRRLTSSARTDERGFTLVEVMVAIFIILVGVLGAVGMIDVANHTTAATRARESGVNIARAVLESAHSIPYSSLDQADAPGAIQLEPGLADSDSGTAGWQISRRNIVYTVSFSACSVDDPADGIGTHDGTFCSGGGSATNPPDTQPADYKRVSVTVSWKTPGATSTTTTTESTVVAGSYRGPSVTGLTGPSGVFTDSTANPALLSFNVTAESGTDHVNWFLDDNDQGAALGCGTFCPISWNLGKATGSPPCDPNGGGVVDGTYVVKASAYDVNGLSGNSRAMTVQINRCPPLAPTGLEGGQTKQVKPPAGATDQWHSAFPGVELQWDQSPEEDVVGYHVYTSPVTFPLKWTQVPANSNPDLGQPDCNGLVKTANCVTADAPAPLYYAVAAVDKDPSGNLREGSLSAPVYVDPTNAPPNVPFKADCYTTIPNSLQWRTNSGDSFYYIYRDSFTGRGDRYDSISNTGGTINWTDPDPAGVAHKYWVTAVDSGLAESDPAPGDPPAHYIQWDATGSTCTKQ